MSLYVRYKHHPRRENGKRLTLNMLLNTFGRPMDFSDVVPDYNRFTAPRLLPTAVQDGLYQALLQDACHPANMPQDAVQAGSPDTEDYTEPTSGKEENVTIEDGTTDTEVDSNYTAYHENYPYSQQIITSEVEGPSGRHFLPVAGGPEGPSTLAVDFHRPIYRRHITMDAERVNRWPVMLDESDFTEEGANHQLVDSSVEPMPAHIAPDGRHTIYRMAGTYTYQLDRKPANIPVPRQTIHNLPSADLVVVAPATPNTGPTEGAPIGRGNV